MKGMTGDRGEVQKRVGRLDRGWIGASGRMGGPKMDRRVLRSTGVSWAKLKGPRSV